MAIIGGIPHFQTYQMVSHQLNNRLGFINPGLTLPTTGLPIFSAPQVAKIWNEDPIVLEMDVKWTWDVKRRELLRIRRTSRSLATLLGNYMELLHYYFISDCCFPSANFKKLSFPWSDFHAGDVEDGERPLCRRLVLGALLGSVSRVALPRNSREGIAVLQLRYSGTQRVDTHVTDVKGTCHVLHRLRWQMTQNCPRDSLFSNTRWRLMKIADIAGCRRKRRKKTKEEKGRHQDPLGRFSETQKKRQRLQPRPGLFLTFSNCSWLLRDTQRTHGHSMDTDVATMAFLLHTPAVKVQRANKHKGVFEK